ncbi:MAG: hypothetical protein FWF24_07655 [Alphaproteobacteria bacterium]|nr:hypothetical protein [Alphaproteobacteria bacterium]
MSFTVRPLLSDDAAALDALLAPRTAEAYYLRSNALAAGLVYEGKALEAEYFGAFERERLVGALAYTWIHTILVYAEKPEICRLLAQAARAAIVKRGGVLDGILGLAAHADAVIASLALPQDVLRLRDNTGLFRLDLEKLRLPCWPEDLSLRLAEEKDRALLVEWCMAFNIEANSAAPGPKLKASVEKEVDLWLKSKPTFMLEKAGATVSFCGIGGDIFDMVIVGPVFTPVALRNQGYGRVVTGYGLKTLMGERPALREATLFASRPDAIRTYENLGFLRTDDWGWALVKEDYRVTGLQANYG